MAYQEVLDRDTALVARTKWNMNDSELYTLVENKLVLSGTVNTFAALPAFATSTDEYWMVKTATGSTLTFNRKSAGIYYSSGSAWVYASINMTYYLEDDNFLLTDATDNTKGLVFQLDQITTGNNRIITMSDYDQNLAYPLFQTTKLDTSYTITGSEVTGETYWDSNNHTTSTVLENGVVMQNGMELPRYGKNASGVIIPNGRAVSVTNEPGQFTTWELTDFTDFSSVTSFIGLATQEIGINDFGYVNTTGLTRDFDTSAWVEKEIVYGKCTSTVGELTTDYPDAECYVVQIGIVEYSHAVSGRININSVVYPRIQDLSGVNGTTLDTNGQLVVWDNSNNYFDFTSNINDYVLISNLDADYIPMNLIGTPTYTSVQDWSNSVQSAGVISGGVITDGGSGTVDVSAITGIVKTTNSVIGENVFFDKSAETGLTLTDEVTNYILIDYNSGTPQITSSTSNIANGHTIFNLGKVFREGTSLDIIDSGLNIYDFSKRIQQHHIEESSLHFVSGATVTETGTRNIAVSAGVMYAGLNRIITDAIDTSIADDFEYYYNDATGWVESDETQISNTQYNDYGVGLAALANNRYGVNFVYKGTNGTTYVVYGIGSYTLSEAQALSSPTNLPEHVSEFGVLRAKIIIAKNGTTFIEIEGVDDIEFIPSTPANHNDLGGLQGGVAGEYYHLTSAEYTIVGNTSGTNTGDQDLSGYQPLLTFGIADTNAVDIDSTSVADNDYAKFTANGLEGRSYSEVKTDLSLNNVENTALSTWVGSTAITTLGTITTGTWGTGAIIGTPTMTLGSDADGDMYYRSSNILTRLAKGTAYQKITMNSGATAPNWSTDYETVGIALSDTSTDLTTGTIKWGYDFPFNFVITRVYATVITAPTGSALQIDVNDEGTTILNAVLSIAVSTNNAETSTFTGSASSYTFSKGDYVSYDIDQVGSTIAGKGLTVFMEGYRI